MPARSCMLQRPLLLAPALRVLLRARAQGKVAAASSACAAYGACDMGGACGAAAAGGSSFIVVCSSDLDCGGGTCTANNMGDVCEESGECTGGAECVLACPSQYLLSGLRSARPHEVEVETGAFVDRMWEPCVRNPQACDAAVFSGLLSPPSPLSPPPVLCACT